NAGPRRWIHSRPYEHGRAHDPTTPIGACRRVRRDAPRALEEPIVQAVGTWGTPVGNQRMLELTDGLARRPCGRGYEASVGRVIRGELNTTAFALEMQEHPVTPRHLPS